MKQNVSERESIWCFRKIVKTSLQNMKSYLMTPSRHGHFHPILILHVKIVKLLQQHANTSSNMQYTNTTGRVPKFVFENVAMYKS